MAGTVSGPLEDRPLNFATGVAEMVIAMSLHQPDHLLDSLAGLEDSLQANEQRSHAMRSRIAHIREQRSAGRPYSEIVLAEERPLIVEMLTQSVRELEGAGV